MDFHTHLTLHWESQPDVARRRNPGKPDPLAPALRVLFWQGYEFMRYRNLIGRKNPLEAPLERILNRVVRSFSRQESEDLVARLDRTGVSQAVVLAVPPVVPNEAVLEGCGKTDRLIPFISPCPRAAPEGQIENWLAAGGRGIKIHPLLQHLRVDGEYVTRVARIAAVRRVPLVIHAGGSRRLFGLDSDFRIAPAEFARLAKRVPGANIIVAHSGLWEWPEILREAAPVANLFLDVSFQNPESIQAIRKKIPIERMLLGSDSPMGNVEIVIENCIRAGFSEPELRALFWENAQRLLTPG
jgi:predicted TIM-barrel fold metal-dependent hydrolase